MMRVAVPLLVLATACGAARPTAAPLPAPAAAHAAANDAWSLAPPRPLAALAIDGSALADVESLTTRLVDTLQRIKPDPKGTIASLISESLHVDGVATFGELGVDSNLGVAVFTVADGWVIVTPIRDRARFVAAVRGSAATTATGVDHIDRVFAGAVCATRRGRYVCASRPDLLDHLGDGGGRIRDRWPAALHGDIEAWATADALHRLGTGVIDATGDAVLVVQAERGELTVRAHVPGRWNDTVAELAAHPARVDPTGTAGFGAVDLRALMPRFVADADETRLPGGITARDLVRAFDGTMSVTVPVGSHDFELRAGLTMPAVVQALLDRVPDLVQLVPPNKGFTASLADGTLHLGFTQGGPVVGLDVWIEAGEVRVAAHRHPFGPGGDGVPLTPIGAELGDGSWTLTAWGRGSLFTDDDQRTPVANLSTIEEWVRAMFRVSELGCGVRVGRGGLDALLYVRLTTADRDEVQAPIEALIDAAIAREKLEPRAAALAARFPHSAFALDERAGYGGLAVPAVAGGVLTYAVVEAMNRLGIH